MCTLWPVDFSNSAAIRLSGAAMPPPAITWRSAATADSATQKVAVARTMALPAFILWLPVGHRLFAPLAQPGEHVGGILVGRKHRIKHLLYLSPLRNKRQPLVELHAGDLEGRQAQKLLQPALAVAQQLERQVQAVPRLLLVVRGLGAQAEDRRLQRPELGIM